MKSRWLVLLAFAVAVGWGMPLVRAQVGKVGAAGGAGAAFTGSGTANTVTKFTGATALGNSDILDSTSAVTAANFAPTTFTIGQYANAAPAGSTLEGVDAVGTDIVGGALSLNGGTSTGTGAGGGITLNLSPAASGSSSSSNALQTALLLNPNGTVTLGGFNMVGAPAGAGVSLAGIGRTGTDLAGGALNIRGGKGTGTGVGGTVAIGVSPAATGSGSSQNATQNVITLNTTNLIIGNTTVTSTPTPSTYGGFNPTGTDQAGAQVTYLGGKSTGTGAPGALNLQVTPNSTTGSTLNTAKNVFTASGTSFTLGGTVMNSGGTALAASTVQGYSAAGTDIAGGDLNLSGGQSTGAGTAGALILKVAPNAATGSSANPLVTAATINGTSVTIGNYNAVSGGSAVGNNTYGGVNAAGTDKVGGNVTILPGNGTGAGAGTQVNIDRNINAATGSTAQGQAHAITACESKILSNTSATATALANITLPNNSAGAARVTVAVLCNDGTNFDSDIVTSYVAYVNKAGTLTIGTAVTTASAAANNSGSCTVTPTFVANGTTSIDIKVTPTITTIVPTTTTGIINVENFGGAQGGGGVVACK